MGRLDLNPIRKLNSQPCLHLPGRLDLCPVRMLEFPLLPLDLRGQQLNLDLLSLGPLDFLPLWTLQRTKPENPVPIQCNLHLNSIQLLHQINLNDLNLQFQNLILTQRHSINQPLMRTLQPTEGVSNNRRPSPLDHIDGYQRSQHHMIDLLKSHLKKPTWRPLTLMTWMSQHCLHAGNLKMATSPWMTAPRTTGNLKLAA